MEITGSKQQLEASGSQVSRPVTAKIAVDLPAVEAKAAPEVKKVEPADIEAALEELRGFMEGLGRDLSFRRDETLEKSIITVFDTSTREVVRQIPSEEVVAIARQIKADLDELRAGVLINGRV